VSGYVNNQPLNGDLVVWYGSSFHHLPRDEDEDHMHPHTTGYSIVPRDLTATNPEP
jgi:primary-amine oxidase